MAVKRRKKKGLSLSDCYKGREKKSAHNHEHVSTVTSSKCSLQKSADGTFSGWEKGTV